MRVLTAFLLLASTFVRAQDSSAPAEPAAASATALEDPVPSPEAGSDEPLFNFDLAPYNVAFGIVADALARLADTGEPLDIPLPLVGPGYYLEVLVRSPKNAGNVPFSQINAVSIEGGLGVPKTQIEIILPGETTAHQTIMIPGPSEQGSDSEVPSPTEDVSSPSDAVSAPTDEVSSPTDQVPAPTDQVPSPEATAPVSSEATPVETADTAVEPTDSAPVDSAPTEDSSPATDEPSAVESSPAETASVPEVSSAVESSPAETGSMTEVSSTVAPPPSSDEAPPSSSDEAPTAAPTDVMTMPNPEASASSQIQQVFSELSSNGVFSDQPSGFLAIGALGSWPYPSANPTGSSAPTAATETLVATTSIPTSPILGSSQASAIEASNVHGFIGNLISISAGSMSQSFSIGFSFGNAAPTAVTGAPTVAAPSEELSEAASPPMGNMVTSASDAAPSSMGDMGAPSSAVPRMDDMGGPKTDAAEHPSDAEAAPASGAEAAPTSDTEAPATNPTDPIGDLLAQSPASGAAAADGAASPAGTEAPAANTDVPAASTGGMADMIGALLSQPPAEGSQTAESAASASPAAIEAGSSVEESTAAVASAPDASASASANANVNATVAEPPMATDAPIAGATPLPSAGASAVSSAPDAIDGLFGASLAGANTEAPSAVAAAAEPTEAPAAEETVAAVQTINILSATDDDALEASIDAVIHSVIGDYRTESVPKAAVGFALIHPRREVVVMGERV